MFFSTLLSFMLCSGAPLKVIIVLSPGNDLDIQPAIQSAVNGASIGDVIELPQGEFVINKSVVINKFISIRGQGIGKTILYRSESTPDNLLISDSWEGMFRFTINSTISSGIIVSDMTLKSKKPSMVDGDGLSVAADIGILMDRCVDFIITRCRFENFGNGAVSVYHDDSIVGGLIIKNEFVHNAKGYDALGLGYGVVIYGTNQKWITNPRFGSSNFIFVEDNTFDYHRHSIAAGGCALYVFRHNDVRNNTAGFTSHAIDAHEARGGGLGTENNFATRAIEVYNNQIINTTYKDGTSDVANGTPIQPGGDIRWLTEACIRPRGGEALVHNNYIEGYRFGVGPVTGGSLGTVYPYPYQCGYASGLKYGASHIGVDGDKGDGDLFMWDDTFHFHAPGTSSNVYFYNYSSGFLQNERDYHFYEKPGYTAYTYPHPLSLTIPAAPLPVSLFSFTAQEENNQALLHWKTGSEINNRGFEIQRSKDAMNWDKIGFVNGALNSSLEKNYSFKDENTLSGKNFYRLLQYDLDGKSVFSYVVNVDIFKAGYYTIGNNPGNGIYRLNIHSTNRAAISVSDMIGRRLMHQQMDAGVHQLDISKYSKGTYLLHLQIGSDYFTEKLIKQ